MRLIKPSAKIEFITPNALALIERAGRTCYKSEDRANSESAEKFVRMIINRGHESVLEHASASVRFIVDRGVSHELVRHRIASFSQESTRYCDYNGGEIEFVIPPWVYLLPGEYLQSEFVGKDLTSMEWEQAMLRAERSYQQLRANGWRPEQARSVLPNSLKTEVVMTANFREWRLFFKLRTSDVAHPQMREVTIPLLSAFRSAVPVVFDDI